MLRHSEQVRALAPVDLTAIIHLLSTSEYTYQRFTLDELEHLLKSYPAVGLTHKNSLRSFLLSQTVNPPSAWIGGFGVSWSESRAAQRFLNLLLDKLTQSLDRTGCEGALLFGQRSGERLVARPIVGTRLHTLSPALRL